MRFSLKAVTRLLPASRRKARILWLVPALIPAAVSSFATAAVGDGLPTYEPPKTRPDTIRVERTVGIEARWLTDRFPGEVEFTEPFQLTAATQQCLKYRPWQLDGTKGDGRRLRNLKVSAAAMDDAGKMSGCEILLPADQPVTLDLGLVENGAKPGEYSGSLEFAAEVEQGTNQQAVASSFRVPVNVFLKAHWLLPLFLLALGLACGWGLTWYRRERLPGHKVLAEISELWEAARLAGFDDSTSTFPAFEKSLKDAAASLHLDDLPSAQKSVEVARAILKEFISASGRPALTTFGLDEGVADTFISEAKRRKLWVNVYYGLTYAIALVLLGAAGFNELYLADKTFGDDGFSDYLAVFVWGFGSQATTVALGQMVQSWNLPGFVSPPARAKA